MKHKLSERIKNFNITILISLFLLISCGSGQQPQAGKDGEAATGGRSLSAVLMEVGRSAENAFYSFLELLSDTLGFTAKSTTTKDDVGKYFIGLSEKLGKASEELEEVAKKSEIDVDEGGLLNKVIKESVEAAKEVLGVLKTNVDSLKDVGDSNLVGWAASDKEGTAADVTELKKAYNAFKGIVETADKEGVTKSGAGNTTVKVGSANNKDGAKILAIDSAGKPAAGDVAKAAAILASVSGEEILASIVNSTEGDADTGVGGQATSNTSAVAFAKGGNGANLAQDAAKAAAVAGGIALRSLVKDGKLAANNNDDDKVAQSAGVAAVNKLLVAVEDIIKKTVKNVLKTVKDKIDEARAPKSAGQQ
ncbi:variable large family protein [Borrelia turicatae]|uniref:variable large family protein n=1 Tax=Borrelia turicatae TaxID=142 RepID=UPI002ED30D7A